MPLGSRPKSEEYEKKFVGIVNVITGKQKARLTIQEEGKKFKNGTTILDIPLDDLPETPKLSREDKNPKPFRVRLNVDQDAVEAFTPVRGHFTGKLVDMGPRPEKDADPAPMEKVFHEGQKDEERHLEFFAVYEITDGMFKGVQLPAYWMHYKFEEDPDKPGFTRFAGSFENKKATRLFQLRDWVVVHGLDQEDIPWSDETILPTLLKRALRNKIAVEINIADGYIMRSGGIMPADDAYASEQFGDDSVDDLDEDDAAVEKDFPKVEEPAPKKTSSPKKPKASKPADTDDDL